MKVEELLTEAHVPFEKKHHAEAFTAQEVAARAHVSGDLLAKVVVVRAGGDYALAVCPATHVVDLEMLSATIGEKARLANEGEMEDIFSDAQLGAEPPFGSLYGMPTYVDESLARHERIVFQAGTHEDTIEMSFADYRKLARPVVGSFTHHV